MSFHFDSKNKAACIDGLIFTTFMSIMALILLMLILSCEDPISPLEEAWEKYEKRAYSEAYALFSEIEKPEAVVGLGWTALRMDSFPEAEAFFESVAADSLTDGYAGSVFVKWRQDHFTQAIEASQFVRRRDPEYIFSHDKSINISDIKLHQAYSLFHVRNYNACNDVIHELDPIWIPSNDPALILVRLEMLYAQYR